MFTTSLWTSDSTWLELAGCSASTGLLCKNQSINQSINQKRISIRRYCLPRRLQGRCHAIDTVFKIKNKWPAASVAVWSSPYERRNNSVFSAFLNQGNDGNDVINGGRLFQTFAAPIVLCFDHGTWISAVDAELSRVRELMRETPDYTATI